jgi:hypothetical protein
LVLEFIWILGFGAWDFLKGWGTTSFFGNTGNKLIPSSQFLMMLYSIFDKRR